MKTLVLILAQGSQTRLPNLTVAKHLLRLPDCGNAPILYRTVHQVARLLDVANSTMVHGHDIRLITWLPTYEALCKEPGFLVSASLTMLDGPGNSSLRGLTHALEGFIGSRWLGRFDRVVVLLGDVVYSWACLRACLAAEPDRPVVFVGTSDLSPAEGELWGLSWHCDKGWALISRGIARALRNHPKFTTYQPGQMRRLLWETGKSAVTYIRIDDYTRDIDLPEHVEMLPQLSRSAREDDTNNELIWGER